MPQMQPSLVLLLDDDPGIVTLERRTLERAGYSVDAATTAEEALAQVRRRQPDLLLLDYRLKGATTGLDVYRNMRAEGFDLPAIVVTGFSDENKVLEALRAGVRDVIPKGGEYLDYLPQAVARVLHQVRAERDALEAEALRRSEEQLRALNADLDRAMALAEQASQAKDHFLAVLSHELRTPLTPVLAGLSMLQGKDGFDEETREDLEVIRRNVDLEARLIDDLLDVTRISRGKIDLDPRPVHLREIIRRAVEVCEPDIKSRGLDLSIDTPDAADVVHADPARLEQVFWNLLRNAIKFTPYGGHVAIRCRCAERTAVVEVTDSGIGIEPDLLPRLFNAFEQAEPSITRQFGGLGLGLTISKALVELHGGRIDAYSAGKGTGATFRVFLPLVSSEPQRETRPPAARPAARRVRILLVEDHRDTAKIMRMLLRLEGHTVEIASDVRAALELAGKGGFDLLISDLGLPDASGLDLMRELRHRGNKIPGIALSGYGQEEDIRQSHEAGFAAHLTKPTSPEKLTEAIDAVVGGKLHTALRSEL